MGNGNTSSRGRGLCELTFNLLLDTFCNIKPVLKQQEGDEEQQLQQCGEFSESNKQQQHYLHLLFFMLNRMNEQSMSGQ